MGIIRKSLYLLLQFCTKRLLQDKVYFVNWNETANRVNTFMISLITNISIQECLAKKLLKKKEYFVENF